MLIHFKEVYDMVLYSLNGRSYIQMFNSEYLKEYQDWVLAGRPSVVFPKVISNTKW